MPSLSRLAQALFLLAGAATLHAQQTPIGGEAPAVSPDGRLIAFLSDRTGVSEMFVIRPDGTAERQLTHGGAGQPRWSPDGRSIRYAGVGADSGKVFVLSLAGGSVTVAADVPGRSPVLSPDGRHVLFLRGPWTSTITAVAASDGGDLHPIAGGGATTAWNGAWSPDGTWIAYTFGDSTRILQVHVIRPDGSEDHAVTRMLAGAGSAQMPAWSADGTRLAVQVSTRSIGRIGVVDVASGEINQLASGGEHHDEVPAWFPDGNHLAFQSDRSGRTEVWTMRADGTDLRQVTGRH